MSKTIQSVPQDELATIISQAVELESQRVEQINAAGVDEVSGGIAVGKPFPDDIIMGMFPVEVNY